jgi:membrane-associated phospholipid phosphatase
MLLASIRERPSGPLFDRDSRFAYGLTLLALLVGGTMFLASGFRFAPDVTAGPPLWSGLAVIAGWLARRINLPQTAMGLETTGLVYAQGFAFMLVIYSLTALPIPLADAQLSAADRALGFYWPSAATPFISHPEATQWAKTVYRSFAWQPALVTVALAFAGQRIRSWQFLTAATVSLCVAAFFGPLLPADSPVVHFGVNWPELNSGHRSYYIIHALKGGRRILDQTMLEGLVSMPSYHTVAAILFAWAVWPIRWLRLPVLALNTVLIGVTTVIGAHYLVDVFAGAILAAASVGLAIKLLPGKGATRED